MTCIIYTNIIEINNNYCNCSVASQHEHPPMISNQDINHLAVGENQKATYKLVISTACNLNIKQSRLGVERYITSWTVRAKKVAKRG